MNTFPGKSSSPTVVGSRTGSDVQIINADTSDNWGLRALRSFNYLILLRSCPIILYQFPPLDDLAKPGNIGDAGGISAIFDDLGSFPVIRAPFQSFVTELSAVLRTK